MIYKPEIDGLRAIAVLLVLMCHMQLGMTGGYIGVDVFFVISGFLITSLIVGGVEAGKFNLLSFYGKRLVRLYPALLVVIALTLLAGFVLADSAFLAEIARSARYAISSTSNIFFSRNVGYFDLAAIQQPFLHTWTLGVEWQFYLISPLLIWLLLKHSKEALIIGLAVIAGASLIASQQEISVNANNAYYLMPFRAFELSIGALLVFIYQRDIKPPISVGLMAIGVAAIFYSGYAFTSQTPFPGYAALLPCLGAAVCIYGGKGLAGKVLQIAPMVYIGKISYSVYLVHWPLLVFWQYVLVFRNITIYDKLAMVALSLLLGAFLYKFVEAKITWRSMSRKLIACLCIVVTGVIGAGISNWIYKHPGSLLWRLGNEHSANIDAVFDRHTASIGDVEGEQFAVLFGDSLGWGYASIFSEYLHGTGKSIRTSMRQGCYMLDNSYVFNQSLEEERQACRQTYQRGVNFLKGNELPLILAQEWLYKFYLRDEKTGEILVFDVTKQDYEDFLIERLTLLRERLGDRKLILIGSPPYQITDEERASWTRKSCAQRPTFLFDVCGMNSKDYTVSESTPWKINSAIKEFAQNNPNTCYIDPSPVICPDGICNTRRNDEFYYPNDPNHFNLDGARSVAPYMWQEIQKCIDAK